MCAFGQYFLQCNRRGGNEFPVFFSVSRNLTDVYRLVQPILSSSVDSPENVFFLLRSAFSLTGLSPSVLQPNVKRNVVAFRFVSPPGWSQTSAAGGRAGTATAGTGRAAPGGSGRGADVAGSAAGRESPTAAETRPTDGTQRRDPTGNYSDLIESTRKVIVGLSHQQCLWFQFRFCFREISETLKAFPAFWFPSIPFIGLDTDVN